MKWGRNESLGLAILFLASTACGCSEEGEPAAPTCAADHLQEEDGSCVPEACGLGTWGDLSPDGDADPIYVVPSGNDDGEGTASDPVESIQEGLDRAGDSEATEVWVAAGTYEENLWLSDVHAGVSLKGRCPALVVLDAGEVTEDADPPAIDIYGGTDTQISGLTVRGGHFGVVNLGGFTPATLSLEDMVFEENYRHAIFVNSPSATVTLRNSTVRWSRPFPDANFGRAVTVQNGAYFEGENLLIEETYRLGLYCGGGEVLLRDSIIRNNGEDPQSSGGRGITARLGCQLTGTGVVLDGNRGGNLYQTHDETSVLLEDSEILASRVVNNITFEDFGYGFQTGGVMAEGGSLVLRRTRFEDNMRAGIRAYGANTSVVLEEVEILNSLPVGDDQCIGHACLGRGISAYSGATITGSQVLVDGAYGIGAFASRPESTISLVDSEIRNIKSELMKPGIGLAAQFGATVGLEGGHISWAAVAAQTTAATLELVDVEIDNLVSDPQVGHSSGVIVVGTELNPVGIEGEPLGDGIGRGVFSNLRITEDQGPALEAGFNSTTTCEDCSFAGSSFAGVVLLDSAEITLERTEISGTSVSPIHGGGHAIYTRGSLDLYPSLTLKDSVITDHLAPALYFLGPGRYVIQDTAIEDNGAGGGLSAVFAQGTTAWVEAEQTGLLLQGNSFSRIEGDALLLHEAGATLDGNSFSEVSGYDLFSQACSEEENMSVVFVDTPAEHNHCEGTERAVLPHSTWGTYLFPDIVDPPPEE